MNARQFRAMAERCRELQRIADRDDIREQLRQWEQEFENEAEEFAGEAEAADFSGVAPPRRRQAD